MSLGNFNTFLGYEVIAPGDNYHYSISYMFSNGPFSHTGIRLDWQISDQVSTMLSLMNSTDYTEFSPVDAYVLGFQLGLIPSDKVGMYFNLLYGDEDGKLSFSEPVGSISSGDLFQVDLTSIFSLSDKYDLGFNATYKLLAAGEYISVSGDIEKLQSSAETNFYGIALYNTYKFSEQVSLGLRAEYFSEKNMGGTIGRFATNGEASVFDLTLTSSITIGALILKPELRYDMVSDNVFLKNNKGDGQSSLFTFLLAAVYTF